MTTMYLLELRYRTVPVIKAVEAERVTDKSIWIRGARKARQGGHFSGTYYDTPEAAQAAALEYAEEQLTYARAQLQRAQDFLGAAKGLLKNFAKAE